MTAAGIALAGVLLSGVVLAILAVNDPDRASAIAQFGGIVSVALVAAVTADVRQRRQLSHDRDLKERELEHAVDLDQVHQARALLTQAASAARVIADRALDLSVMAATRAANGAPGGDTEVLTAMAALQDSIYDGFAVYDELLLWFASSEDVAVTYMALLKSWGEVRSVRDRLKSGEPLTEDVPKRLDAVTRAATDRQGAFLEAARRRLWAGQAVRALGAPPGSTKV